MLLLEIRALQMLGLPRSLMIEGRMAGESVSGQATGHLAILEGAGVEKFLLVLADFPASALQYCLESAKQLNLSAIPLSLTHVNLILAWSGAKVGAKLTQAKVKRVKRG